VEMTRRMFVHDEGMTGNGRYGPYRLRRSVGRSLGSVRLEAVIRHTANTIVVPSVSG
jgi:hypothetical protein